MKLPHWTRLDSTRTLLCLRTVCYAIGIAAIITIAGCKSGQSTAPITSSSSTNSTSSGPAMPTETAAVVAEVERSHVIGPGAAGEFNYRVAWQYIGGAEAIEHFSVQGDSVFTLDNENFLTRIKIADGNRLWRMQVAETIEEVLGVTFTGNRVFVTTGGAILALDANTGSQLQRQIVRQIASTSPVLFGPYLIYGTRNGQVAWHSSTVGQFWRSYQVAHALHVPPTLHGMHLAAVAEDGTVMVLHPATTRQYWSKRLLAPVVCAPAIGDEAIYVAGMDQYLWAYDVNTGRNLWRMLTESQLVDSPVLLGDRVYQQVPRIGLHCFDALPWDHPGGKLHWNAPAVSGNVLFQLRSDLYVWDQTNRRMSIVDAARGSLVKSINAPAASRVIAAGTDLYAASDDGRVVRLVPRN